MCGYWRQRFWQSGWPPPPVFTAHVYDEFVGLFRVRERLVDQRLEKGFGCQHGVDAAVDDLHERCVLSAEFGIEGKAWSGKEGLGFSRPFSGRLRTISLSLASPEVRWMGLLTDAISASQRYQTAEGAVCPHDSGHRQLVVYLGGIKALLWCKS